MRDLHAIRTPENVTFEFELAGLSSRALSWLIDVFVMSFLIVLAILVFSVFKLWLGGFARAVYVVALFVIQWGYGAGLEWRFQGQTIGKRAMGLRVLSSHGTPITFGQAAIRNLLHIVDLLPGAYLLGATSVVLDARGRRFGDIAADTVVVRVRRSPRPSAMVAPSDRYNSLARDAGIAHAARSITAPERDAMLGLALRREQLPLAVRHRLFAKLAKHLEQRLGVRCPDFFSEERFVLNVTAIALESASEVRAGDLHASPPDTQRTFR
jgi:uncharacterized RDD family membrane protein YckC